MNQRSGGKIDLDTDPASGGGNLINIGTWNLLGDAKISSTHFKGRFINAGVLQTVDAGGAAIMISDFDSRNGSEIRTAAGSSLTLHGSIGLAEGPAKGGFFLDGGVLQGTPPILGFGGQAGDFLAAERGKFGNDTINGVTVRLTGDDTLTSPADRRASWDPSALLWDPRPGALASTEER